MTLYVKRLHKEAVIPKRGSEGAAGYDLYSLIDININSYKKAVIPTGIMMIIPDGYYGRIASRSGLSAKYDIEVGAGVIDSDYRGEIKVILRNFSEFDYVVDKGEKIAQIIIEPIITPNIIDATDLDDNVQTERGENGFGSTGKFDENKKA
jgi:dUTP pyrophosphatase